MPLPSPTRRELLAGLAAAPAAAGLFRADAASALAPHADSGGERPTAVVVGSGVFGVWSAWHLHRAGYAVTLVDAWGPGNARASSGGESRVTRTAYGPDAIYSKMAHDSLPEWQALSERHGGGLFHPTGVLWMGDAADARIAPSHATLTALGIEHEILDPAAIGARFPQIALDGVARALWEPRGGALLARRCVAAVAAELEAAGVARGVARIETPRPANGRLAAVRSTSGETFTADRFVFACGPWLGTLFPDVVGPRLFVTRQEVLYFGPPAGDTRFAPPAMPIWMIGEIYGLPDLECRGFKVADDRHGPPQDPDSAERVPSAAAIATARALLASRFPALANAPLVEARVCQYENSANGDFLLDRHPEAANAVLVGCGSGHGFKHGPAVGALAAKLAADSGAAAEPRFTLASKGTVQHRAVH